MGAPLSHRDGSFEQLFNLGPRGSPSGSSDAPTGGLLSFSAWLCFADQTDSGGEVRARLLALRLTALQPAGSSPAGVPVRVSALYLHPVLFGLRPSTLGQIARHRSTNNRPTCVLPFSLSSTPPVSFIARMSHSIIDPGELWTLGGIATHVFLPLRLPDGDKHSIRHDRSLATAIASAARLYSDYVSEADMPQWRRILRMLDNLQATAQFEGLDGPQIISQLSNMDVGGKFLSLRSILNPHDA